jgi:hypothetical protein
MPAVDWIGLTFNIFVQFGHCMMLLFKLTTLSEPGWDTNEVKKRANVLDMIERTSQRFSSLHRLLEQANGVGIEEHSVFFKATRLTQGLKALFLAKMTSIALLSEGQSSDDLSTANSFEEYSALDDSVMDLADDPWLTEIFASWVDF